MPKMLRGVDYEMAGLSGSKKKAKKKSSKKSSKKGSKKFSTAGYKSVAKKTCVRMSGPKKGTLKKGCKWGRGKFKGKVFKKVA